MSFADVTKWFIEQLNSQEYLSTPSSSWKLPDQYQMVLDLPPTEQLDCYNTAIQWGIDNIDAEDKIRAEVVTFLVTGIIVESYDFYLDRTELSLQSVKNHFQLVLKFCTKFPDQCDGMWRSTIFCYTESFSPLTKHQPYINAAVFDDGADDIFTITKQYLVSLDEARQSKDAAFSLQEQVGHFSLFYRELSQLKFTPTSPAAIFDLLIASHEIVLKHMEEFFNNEDKATEERLLWPQSHETGGTEVAAEGALPIQYFFKSENGFSCYPDGQIDCISRYVKYIDAASDEEKQRVITAWALTPEFKAKCFQLALTTTSYLKYLKGGLNERQIGYMARDVIKLKDAQGFADEVKKLAEAKEHPLWEPLFKSLE